MFMAIGLVPVWRADITEAEALRIAERAVRQVWAVSRQLAGATESEQSLNQEVSQLKTYHYPNPSSWEIRSAKYSVGVDIRTGRIKSVIYAPAQRSASWDDSLSIADDRIVEVAQAYYRAIGGTLPLKLLRKDKYENGAWNNDWMATVAPTWHGVTFFTSSAYQLDHQTGVASLVASIDIPEPPSSVVPSSDVFVAKSNAVSRIFALCSVDSLLESQAPELYIWKPQRNPVTIHTDLNAADLARGDQNGGQLIYWVGYRPGDAPETSPGIFFAKVDANDGRVLDLVDATGFSGVKPGSGSAAVHLACLKSWNLQKGRVFAWTAGKPPRSKLSGALALCTAPKGPFAGKRVLLSRGKLALSVEFDQAKGILKIGRDRVAAYAKPSAEMTKLLREALAAR